LYNILIEFYIPMKLVRPVAHCAVRNRTWTSIQDLLHPNSWQTPVAAVRV